MRSIDFSNLRLGQHYPPRLRTTLGGIVLLLYFYRKEVWIQGTLGVSWLCRSFVPRALTTCGRHSPIRLFFKSPVFGVYVIPVSRLRPLTTVFPVPLPWHVGVTKRRPVGHIHAPPTSLALRLIVHKPNHVLSPAVSHGTT